jgi:hypothetical protein
LGHRARLAVNLFELALGGLDGGGTAGRHCGAQGAQQCVRIGGFAVENLAIDIQGRSTIAGSQTLLGFSQYVGKRKH